MEINSKSIIFFKLKKYLLNLIESYCILNENKVARDGSKKRKQCGYVVDIHNSINSDKTGYKSVNRGYLICLFVPVKTIRIKNKIPIGKVK